MIQIVIGDGVKLHLPEQAPVLDKFHCFSGRNIRERSKRLNLEELIICEGFE